MADERTPCVFEIDDAIDALLAQPQTNRRRDPRGRASVQRSSCRSCIICCGRTPSTPGIPTDRRGSWPRLRSASAPPLAAESAAGDVVLPDGTLVWLDGGPIRYTEPIDGVAVVHRIAIEHRLADAVRVQHLDRRPGRRPVGGGHPSGGASRVIAPAGSGKTRVLTERARHLLTQWRLPASSVCLVAFNKRAQEEMSSQGRRPAAACRCARSTRSHWPSSTARRRSRTQPTTMTTITELDVRRIIGKLVEFPRKRNSDPVALWIEALSLARLGLRDPSEVEALYDGDVDGFAAMLPAVPAANSAALAFARLRRADRAGDRDPAHRPAGARRGPTRLQGLAGRRVPGPHTRPPPAGAAAGRARRMRVRRRRRRPDDLRVQRCGPAMADRLCRLLPARRRPSAGGQLPMSRPMSSPRRQRCCSTTPAESPRSFAPLRRLRADDRSSAATTLWQRRSRSSPRRSPTGSRRARSRCLTRVNSLLAPVQVALGVAGIADAPAASVPSSPTGQRCAVRWHGCDWRRRTGACRRSISARRCATRRDRLRPNIAGMGGRAGLARRPCAGWPGGSTRHASPNGSRRSQPTSSCLQQLARSGRIDLGASCRNLHDSMGMASTLSTLDTHRKGMNRAAQSDDLTAVAQLAVLQPDPAAFESWLRSELRRSWQSDGVTLGDGASREGQGMARGRRAPRRRGSVPASPGHRRRGGAQGVPRRHHPRSVARARRAGRPSVAVHRAVPATARPGRAGARHRARAARQPRDSRSRRPATPGRDLTPAESALFEELRSVRRHLAAGKPAYTVLSDQSLHDIARRRPTTLAAARQHQGHGPGQARTLRQRPARRRRNRVRRVAIDALRPDTGPRCQSQRVPISRRVGSWGLLW